MRIFLIFPFANILTDLIIRGCLRKISSGTYPIFLSRKIKTYNFILIMMIPPMDKNMRDLILFFKIISKIKVGEKINLGNGKFVSSASMYGSFYRFWKGENRDVLIESLEEKYDEGWDYMDSEKDENFKELLKKSLIDSKDGLINLIETYTGDNVITGRLSILVDKINIWMRIGEKNDKKDSQEKVEVPVDPQ